MQQCLVHTQYKSISCENYGDIGDDGDDDDNEDHDDDILDGNVI